jgi:hypothetical protein
MRRVLFVRLLTAICASQCACTWLDHRSDESLRAELGSKAGLALARIQSGDAGLDVRYFDGQTALVTLACCPRTEGQTIARNRIVLVDLTSAPVLDNTKFLRDPRGWGADLLAQGGPVVVMDERGGVLERSELSVNASLISLSPDEKTVAFLGVRRGEPEAGLGIFLMGFRGEAVRRLMPVAAPVPDDARWRASLDWSPDGKDLLYSAAEGVLLVNAQTGESRKIAEGGFAQWAPSGDWITYTTLSHEGVLLSTATGERKTIDPGYEVIAPIEWSPDGKDLLVREGMGSHVPYGCYWIYRISDGAFEPLQDLGVAGPRPHWITLGGSSKNQR